MEVTVMLVVKLWTVTPIHCASLKTGPDGRSCCDVMGAQSVQNQQSNLSISM